MKKAFKNVISRIFLLLMIVCVVCPVLNLLAVDDDPLSYEAFFSQEQTMMMKASEEVNADWLTDPFIMTQEKVNVYRHLYPNTEMLLGSVYQERRLAPDRDKPPEIGSFPAISAPARLEIRQYVVTNRARPGEKIPRFQVREQF